MSWAPAAGTPLWVVLAAAVAGTLVGHLLGARLQTRGYRLDAEAQRPRRIPGWAVALVLGPVWAALAWRFGPAAHWALLPALLCFTAVAVALVWVDLDVHRLPEGLTLPAFPILFVQLGLAAWAGADWGLLLRSVVGAVALGAIALALALLAAALRSGFGLGDVVLCGLVGLVTGAVGWWHPLVALYSAFLLGGAYALVHVVVLRRSGREAVPFGPFLVAGSVLTLFVDVPPLL
ncbi:prepilin peptidase [Intrasporangium chromatireducens]|uniref:prepilin peptidase n=1 Tax=Intrasporangium chromatireducens TaxID=1386088 RepID=UPI000554C37F|nr:A24 family peptidase [Intrasporangium chromatireducens]